MVITRSYFDLWTAALSGPTTIATYVWTLPAVTASDLKHATHRGNKTGTKQVARDFVTTTMRNACVSRRQLLRLIETLLSILARRVINFDGTL